MAVAKYPVYHSYYKIKQNVFNNQVSISAVGQFIKNTVVKPQFKNYDCGTEGKLIVNPDGFWLNKHASSEAVEVKNVALFTG